jgi:hypothetical protein
MAIGKDYEAHVAAMNLDEVILESTRNQAALTEWDERKKYTNDRIKALMLGQGMVVGNAYVREDGIGATLQVRTTKTINRLKLIEKDVDAAIIDACTDVNTSEPFVTVRVPPSKKETKG